MEVVIAEADSSTGIEPTVAERLQTLKNRIYARKLMLRKRRLPYRSIINFYGQPPGVRLRKLFLKHMTEIRVRYGKYKEEKYAFRTRVVIPKFLHRPNHNMQGNFLNAEFLLTKEFTAMMRQEKHEEEEIHAPFRFNN